MIQNRITKLRRPMILPTSRNGEPVRWLQVLKVWNDASAEALDGPVDASAALNWLDMNRNEDRHDWNVAGDGRKYRYQVRELDLASIRYAEREPLTLDEAIAARAASDRELTPTSYDDRRRYNVVIIRLSDGAERVDRHLVDDTTAKGCVQRFDGQGLYRAEAREIDLQTLKPTGDVLRPPRRKKTSVA